MHRPAGPPGRSGGPGWPTRSTGSIERRGSVDIGRRRACRSATRLRSSATWISRRPPMRRVRGGRRHKCRRAVGPSCAAAPPGFRNGAGGAENACLAMLGQIWACLPFAQTDWREPIGTRQRCKENAVNRRCVMTNVQGESRRASVKTDFDAVIIGAGFSGMYMLHSLRDKLDLNVTVFEAGDGVGGTWYWNRYPGARCDSDSYIYCSTFDKNLLQEWNWSERYPEQDEILRYLEHCAERFDLKPDIQFGKRVVEVIFDDNTELWTVRTDKGDVVRARFVITAVGALSTANMPPIKGLSSFKGKSYHTSQWPHDGVDFTAKRVGVIGTGATAVQAIPEVAQQAKHLTVFQRTPNFCVPARNGRVDPEVTKARKADYDGIRERIKNSFFGFELNFIPKSVLETPPEEREQEFDKMWDAGGFAFWLANYQDMFFSKEANDVIADYPKPKIRPVRNDPSAPRQCAHNPS